MRDRKWIVRHRSYESARYMFDVDAVWTNQQCRAMAFVEEKSPYCEAIDVNGSQQCKLIRNTADACGAPFLIVVPYFIDRFGRILRPEVELTEEQMSELASIQFRVCPGNEAARALYPGIVELTELEMYRLECRLTGGSPDAETERGLYRELAVSYLRPRMSVPDSFLHE